MGTSSAVDTSFTPTTHTVLEKSQCRATRAAAHERWEQSVPSRKFSLFEEPLQCLLVVARSRKALDVRVVPAARNAVDPVRAGRKRAATAHDDMVTEARAERFAESRDGWSS